MAKRMKMDLLTAVELIVELAKDSQLNKEFYKKANKYIKYMSTKLELTKEQSVMMALFINHSDDNRILIRDISKDMDCSTIRILRYLKDIDELEKRELIRCCRERRSSLSYRVPYDVIEAFKRDEKYVPKKCKNLTCVELFSELEEIFQLRQDYELTFDAMSQKIHSLLEDNPQLLFTKAIKQYGWEEMEEEKMLFLLFCHLYVNNNDNNILFRDLDFLYDNKRTWNRVKNQLARGRHILFIEDIIENNNDDGMLDRESFRMTQKAKDEFFPELDLKNRNNNDQRKDIVKCEKIVEKQLFYGKNIQAQIDELSQLLDNAHYQEVHSRMKESGFRCGFTCLFYGAPGTGKTETVLQLARKTGRNIMQVNISQIKSCWVGESEKNIKGLFDNYRELVKKSDGTPILLFNEADAIINKRTENVEHSVDKMDNAMQNIILQEIEDLDGILIATTNLTSNLDKAFERRFLYKVEFHKPDTDVKTKIWCSMLKDISIDDAHQLASHFDFSGGQIENIARKRTVDYILSGKFASLTEIEDYCRAELLADKKQRKPIGFSL